MLSCINLLCTTFLEAVFAVSSPLCSATFDKFFPYLFDRFWQSIKPLSFDALSYGIVCYFYLLKGKAVSN